MVLGCKRLGQGLANIALSPRVLHAVNPLLDLVLRTVSTLIATLATVAIITERQRRMNNARIELAARYIESLEHTHPSKDPCKDVVRDLKLAQVLIRDIAWGRVARASKIEDVVRINRRLAHVLHKHERLEADPSPSAGQFVESEVANGRFADMATEVRGLKISFVDFIFIDTGNHRSGPIA
jgi:hypothetical protein